MLPELGKQAPGVACLATPLGQLNEATPPAIVLPLALSFLLAPVFFPVGMLTPSASDRWMVARAR